MFNFASYTRGNKDLIPMDWLESMTAISTLKVLLAFFRKHKQENSLTFKYALQEIYSDSGVSPNSTRKALGELSEKGYIRMIEQGSGKTPNTYRICVSEVEGPQVEGPRVAPSKVEPTTLPEGWQKSDGARKKRTLAKQDDANTSIKDLDLFSYNLYEKDINSLSVVNPNIYLKDAELGQLANRILREVFMPRTEKGQKPAYWFPQQMKILKDLLVEYRTEQVIAGIVYWTEVNPTGNGMVSVRWLLFKDKNGSKLMQALDYYKSEYLKQGGSSNAEELLDNALRKQEEDQMAREKEKAEVAQMSDADFVSSLLGGFGSIKI